MKFSLFLISSLLSVGLSSAIALPAEDVSEADVLARDESATEQVEPIRPFCVSRRRAIPFFRLFNAELNDHFYTTNPTEVNVAISSLGYKSEGIAAYIFRTRQTNTVPLFRLYNPTVTDHFYTTDRNERNNAMSNLGYRDEGIAGWVYRRGICNSVPLFRLYSPTEMDHFYTRSRVERNSAMDGGYTAEGIAAWVLPSNR